MKLLFAIAVVAATSISCILGQCDTAKDALCAMNAAIEDCSFPDEVIVVQAPVLYSPLECFYPIVGQCHCKWALFTFDYICNY